MRLITLPSCMLGIICEPSNHTALRGLRRLQISEHVERRELSCEAESLRLRDTRTPACVPREMFETVSLKQY